MPLQVVYGAFAHASLGEWPVYSRAELCAALLRGGYGPSRGFVAKPASDGTNYGLLVMTPERWKRENWTAAFVATIVERFLYKPRSSWGQWYEQRGVVLQTFYTEGAPRGLRWPRGLAEMNVLAHLGERPPPEAPTERSPPEYPVLSMARSGCPPPTARRCCPLLTARFWLPLLTTPTSGCRCCPLLPAAARSPLAAAVACCRPPAVGGRLRAQASRCTCASWRFRRRRAPGASTCGSMPTALMTACPPPTARTRRPPAASTPAASSALPALLCARSRPRLTARLGRSLSSLRYGLHFERSLPVVRSYVRRLATFFGADWFRFDYFAGHPQRLLRVNEVRAARAAAPRRGFQGLPPPSTARVAAPRRGFHDLPPPSTARAAARAEGEARALRPRSASECPLSARHWSPPR